MNRKLVYIKISQNVKVHKQKVLLEDIAKIYCVDKSIVYNLYAMQVYEINSKKNCKYSFSVLKIIELISERYHEFQIVNMGETDFIIEYKIPNTEKKFYECIKTVIVAFIIFFGSAFSIMTFNTDVGVMEVFEKTYELVLGDTKNGGFILEISYCIGLPIGIIIFFNHFSKIKIHDDPTPMQIEMRLYEEDVNKTLIQNSSREDKTIDTN